MSWWSKSLNSNPPRLQSVHLNRWSLTSLLNWPCSGSHWIYDLQHPSYANWGISSQRQSLQPSWRHFCSLQFSFLNGVSGLWCCSHELVDNVSLAKSYASRDDWFHLKCGQHLLSNHSRRNPGQDPSNQKVAVRFCHIYTQLGDTRRFCSGLEECNPWYCAHRES